MLHLISLLMLLWGSAGTETADPEPRVLVRFLVNGLPINDQIGAPSSLKEVRFQGVLDKRSRESFPELADRPVLAKGSVTLARGTRRVSMIAFDTKLSPIILTSLGQAQPGDRILIELRELGIEQKNGTVRMLKEQAGQLYQFGLY